VERLDHKGKTLLKGTFTNSREEEGGDFGRLLSNCWGRNGGGPLEDVLARQRESLTLFTWTSP